MFYSLLDLRSGECDVVSLYVLCFSVNGSVCFVCCVFDSVFLNCLLKQFAMCLGVISILVLNVMEVFSVCGSALLDRPCMQSVCCTCDPSECLGAPSICCLRFCMSEVISLFRSLRAGSQVFALLMLFLCVILHTVSLGKSLQMQCILPFGTCMLCLSAISMMFVKIMLAVCIVFCSHVVMMGKWYDDSAY